jgi:hypothetical protein
LQNTSSLLLCLHFLQLQCTGSARAAAVLAEHRTKRLASGGPRGMAAQAAALIAQHGLDDTTYIYDLGNTTRLFRAWRAALPRVQPFYAVKVGEDSGGLAAEPRALQQQLQLHALPPSVANMLTCI